MGITVTLKTDKSSTAAVILQGGIISKSKPDPIVTIESIVRRALHDAGMAWLLSYSVILVSKRESIHQSY